MVFPTQIKKIEPGKKTDPIILFLSLGLQRHSKARRPNTLGLCSRETLELTTKTLASGDFSN